MSQTVVLNVAMTCKGCSGAVKRVLDKMEGVESYDINLEEKKVTVTGNITPEAVLQTVSKTGKKTSYWEEAAPAPAPAPAEVEAELGEAKAEPVEAGAKPAEDEAKPAEAETKPAEAVAAP
ncbi:hypothetical protein BVRB_4g095130 [Beta vulgaris subsp. vulgaris]|uniref:HMA domain-containing protein n=1 Tax=Beta vulgaris subsp. vulgaris TaxID=3555 RepID=A0A0J8BBC3_BETVV|nr:copper transport protein ATX1 [Beta vulgaris subsp. vulgaris]KMS98186.1 hypothetical protein BVRB_4g095130 [Beta vulgaris subsp. vulgaris]